MSITLASMRGILTNKIGDVLVTGTTSGAGNTNKTTAVDSSLAEFDDTHYFEGWTLYLTVAAEGRTVKEFMPPSGTLLVSNAYTAQVGAPVAYELHRYDPDNKKIALNQALRDVYPYYYKRLYDTTLYGQNSYGVDPNEFNKFTYTVPSTFSYFPDQIWLQEGYIGTHTGSDGDAALEDTTKSWETSELVGLTLYNKTDGSSGTVTANTSTAVSATLSGGTNSDWDADDEYIIQNPSKKPIRLTDFTVIDPANIGSFQFYADINEKYIIALVGQAQLTQFTDDASETELTGEQAEVVCLKAAVDFYRIFSSLIDAQDSGRADSLAARYQEEFDDLIHKRRMPIIKQGLTIDWGFSK